MEEYAKLPAYDLPTQQQPTGVFLCHQTGRGDRARVCAGWAGCHDTANMLALRFAGPTGTMTSEAVAATLDYRTDVPLFRSGAEAARHGLAEVNRPSARASRTMAKIARVRGDIKTRKGLSDGTVR